MQVCMKNSRFSTNIWSITARSSPLGRPSFSLYHVSDDGGCSTQYPLLRLTCTWAGDGRRYTRDNWSVAVFATLQWSYLRHIASSDDDTPKINCAKSSIFGPRIWRPPKISPPMQIFTPFGASREKYIFFLGGDRPMLYIFRKLSSSWF